MATDEPRSSPPGLDGVRDYTLLSLASLLILGLLLFLEGLGLWAMIPVLVGCLSVLRAKGGGPAVTLFLLLLVLYFRNWIVGLPSFYRMPSSAMSDALVGFTLLLYVVSHARLLSLKAHAVPGDSRREFVPRDRRVRGRWLLPATETRRPASKVEPAEFVWLLAGLPVFLALAFFVWISVVTLSARQTYWIFSFQFRALILAWIGGFALLLGYAANAYLGRARASREESLLYLQDQLWDETRGEQQRINQRVVEARLRRKERP
jgi:hypothetical protein